MGLDCVLSIALRGPVGADGPTLVAREVVVVVDDAVVEEDVGADGPTGARFVGAAGPTDFFSLLILDLLTAVTLSSLAELSSAAAKSLVLGREGPTEELISKKKKEEKKDALATFEQRLNERSKTKSDRYCMHIFRDS